MTKRNLIVLSSVPPPSASPTTNGAVSYQYALDQLDDFNHPRQRRDILLNALQLHANGNEEVNAVQITFDTVTAAAAAAKVMPIEELSALFHDLYSTVHSTPLLTFLETAWDKWVALGDDGRDPIGCAAGTTGSNTSTGTSTNTNTTSVTSNVNIPSLVPACTPLMRCHNQSTKQRASQHVIGQMSYYCTDTCTPIFHHLKQEMYNDTQLLQNCLQRIQAQTDSTHDHAADDDNRNHNNHHSVYYIIPNHPGHHAAYDCFGGYCYVNHIAALAKNIVKLSSLSTSHEKVVILDVDYHCGNGTAAIFQQHEDENIMVISIHCDPDYDYPFHIGFLDDSTTRVIHLPLPPGTGWDSGYRAALLQAIQYIHDFHPTTLLVSLGIDTFENDPCTIRRAGFTLQLDDYIQMGSLLATEISKASSALHQTIFVQEGGYRMDVIGDAARNVVVSYAQNLV